ncbi:Pro-resilin-like 99 [Homarus americanus]|uniref:Pro-resilin-like 99 n=1 Tax=Homarus americanus TaxID=6706 RepID=A0A8J5MXL9_HOMAM|nr:Pro-resilin-like 99 [Homarus americanus]
MAAGVSLTLPQYNYQRPQQPTGLYRLPTTPPTTTTTTTAHPAHHHHRTTPTKTSSQSTSHPRQPTSAPRPTAFITCECLNAEFVVCVYVTSRRHDTLLTVEVLCRQPPPTGPMEGMPYDFQWGVTDQDSGNAFSHVENSDGRTTQGEYRVLMPDGRTQVVTFYDNGDGFNADVTYV